jgi:hypothetical protein
VDEFEKDTQVAKKGHSEEQILRALRQAESGTRVADICCIRAAAGEVRLGNALVFAIPPLARRVRLPHFGVNRVRGLRRCGVA